MAFKIGLLLLAVLLGTVWSRKADPPVIETKCKTVIGTTNQRYESKISADTPMSYVFYIDKKYIQWSHVSDQKVQTTNLRVEGDTDPETSLAYPIMFAVRQQRYISSFEVPFRFDYDGQEDQVPTHRKIVPNLYYNAARTLCIPEDDDGQAQGRNVTIRVSTQNPQPVRFTLTLKLTEDFQLPVGKEVSLDVSPTAPKFYGFTFGRPDISTVRLRASSESTDCMTISIQTLQCPIYDLEHNVRYKGVWQTMTTTAAMTVQNYGRFAQGFVIVLVVHDDMSVCGRTQPFSSRSNSSLDTGYLYSGSSPHSQSKTIKLIVTNESKMPAWVILLCLFIPIIATLLTALAVLALFRNRHEWMGKILREFKTSETVSWAKKPNSDRNGHHTTEGRGEDNEAEEESIALNPETHSPTIPPLSVSPYQTQTTLIRSETSGKFQWKADLHIADFTCKQFHEVKKFAKRFYWTIAIVAIFYSIPVYQLVLHYLRVLYSTGEFDICYYNYLCAQRLGVLIDFNHFWSNASYVIFGVLFIIIVRRRSQNLCVNAEKQDDESNDGLCCCSCYSPGKVGQACLCTFSRICFRWDHGVPAHFGVFYALGVALTMEGFLSAAYHLCPNQSTFQFDTCFMYVIAVLLLLKIYQFRHPVHFGANHTFAILAGFVIVSVLGLMFEQGNDNAKLIFKCIFLPFQYIIMVLLCVYYYAVGYVKNDRGEQVTDWSIYTRLGQLKSQTIRFDRLLLPLISFLICVAVLVYSELSKMEFASYLLYILVGNVLGTTLYYVGIMKPLHGEFKDRTWVQPTLYFVAAGIIGGLSMQYFVRAPAKWELSASASRAENEDCLAGWFPFHPFYDSHDAWHFLSAAALFLAFMGLLIVDDDLITTPQTRIPVF